MSKLIVKNRYGVIPNDILNNKELSLKTKGLFAYMQSKPPDWKFSIDRMSHQTKEGTSAIREAIKELENYGLLKRKPLKNENGKWNGYDYILFEKPSSGNLRTGNPTTGNYNTISNKDISKQDIVIKTFKKEKIINYNLEDKKLTDLLYSLIKENYSWIKPKSEKGLENDYKEMNRLNRIDKWNYKQIEFVIKWCQNDNFWKMNIRSVSKLRKQFSSLLIRIKEQDQQKNKIAIYQPNK